MIVTTLALLALFAPLPLILIDVQLSQPTKAITSPPVEAFASTAGCPVVPGRSA